MESTFHTNQLNFTATPQWVAVRRKWQQTDRSNKTRRYSVNAGAQIAAAIDSHNEDYLRPVDMRGILISVDIPCNNAVRRIPAWANLISQDSDGRPPHRPTLQRPRSRPVRSATRFQDCSKSTKAPARARPGNIQRQRCAYERRRSLQGHLNFKCHR